MKATSVLTSSLPHFKDRELGSMRMFGFCFLLSKYQCLLHDTYGPAMVSLVLKIQWMFSGCPNVELLFCSVIQTAVEGSGSLFRFILFSQGDACTSCPTLGSSVGDGVAVPGPKGERGEPGPPGQGKPGRNVRGLCFIDLFFLSTVQWE